MRSTRARSSAVSATRGARPAGSAAPTASVPPRAMEPLFTTGNPEERSGLGFAVMQSFMDKVSVRSAPGRGTRVILTKHLEEKPST